MVPVASSRITIEPLSSTFDLSSFFFFLKVNHLPISDLHFLSLEINHFSLTTLCIHSIDAVIMFESSWVLSIADVATLENKTRPCRITYGSICIFLLLCHPPVSLLSCLFRFHSFQSHIFSICTLCCP